MHKDDMIIKKDDNKVNKEQVKTYNKETEGIESTADASISVIQETSQTLYLMNQKASNQTVNLKRQKNEVDFIKEDLEEDILEYGIASTDLIEEIDKNVIERFNKVESVEEQTTICPEITEETPQGIITNRESNKKRRESIREGMRERRNSLIGKIYNKIEIEDKNRLLNFNIDETKDLENTKKTKDCQIHTQRSINFKAAFSKIINELSHTVEQVNEKLVNIKLNQDSYSMTVESSHFDSLLNDDEHKKIKFQNLEKNLKSVFKDLCVKYDVINSLDNLENKTINYEERDETNKLTKEILESHYGDYKKLLFEKMKETDCTQIEARNKFLNEKIIKEKQKYEYNKSVLEDLLKSINDAL